MSATQRQPQVHEVPTTFGLELEFLIATLPQGATNPNPQETRQAYGLHSPPPGYAPDYQTSLEATDHVDYDYNLAEVQKLQNVKAWIAAVLEQYGFPCYTDDVVGVAGVDKVSRWYITDDVSVKPSNNYPDGYQYFNIEINSPVYFYSPDSLAAIEQVFNILTTHFLINVNLSTGIHVHVGKNGHDGMDPDHLKRFLLLTWAFEPQLEAIHPWHRRQNIGNYCHNFRAKSQFTKSCDLDAETTTRDEGGFLPWEYVDVKKGLDMLFTQKDSLGLKYWMSTAKEVAYNLANLDRAKRTVEFRQHESTLDAVRVRQWVNVAVLIWRAALIWPMDDLWEKANTHYGRTRPELQRDGPGEQWTIYELLDYIRAHEPARFYEQFLARNPTWLDYQTDYTVDYIQGYRYAYERAEGTTSDGEENSTTDGTTDRATDSDVEMEG